MDPELQAQAVEVYRRAIELGASADQAAATARLVLEGGPSGPRPGIVGGVLASGAQGATLGLSDEIYGGVRALGAMVPGGKSPAEAYTSAAEGSREYLQDFGEDHPVLRAGADLAGGLGVALATGGVAAGARGAVTAGRLARIGAAEGAIIGGIEGAARTEGVSERVVGAGAGAALGAGFGAAAGALTPLISRAGATGAGAVIGGGAGYAAGGDATGAGTGALAGAGAGRIGGRLATRLARVAGPAGPATSGERASVAAARALEREGVTPTQLSRVAAEAPDVNLLGLTGRVGPESSVQRLARGAQSIPSRGSAEMSTFLRRESDEAPGRIREALQRDTGLKFENVHETLDQAAARQRATARPLYEEAYQHSVPITENLADALSDDAFRKAYERGRRIARLDGVDLPELPDFVGLSDMGADISRIEGLPDIPVQAIDYMKRGLDDLVDSGMRAGSIGRTEARALRNRLRSVLEEVDEQVPAFAQARAAWAGDEAAQEAMEAARTGNRDLGVPKSFLNESPEAIERAMQAMTPSEREFYRRGALDSIREMLEKRQDTRADLARLLIGRSGGDTTETGLRKRLRLLFDTDRDMQEFVRSMLDERSRASAGQFILGGSPTQRIAAEQADLGQTSGPGSFNVRQIVVETLRDRVGRFLTSMTEGTVDELAPRLTGPVSETAPLILGDLESFGRRLRARSGIAGRAGAANLGALVGAELSRDDSTRIRR